MPGLIDEAMSDTTNTDDTEHMLYAWLDSDTPDDSGVDVDINSDNHSDGMPEVLDDRLNIDWVNTVIAPSTLCPSSTLASFIDQLVGTSSTNKQQHIWGGGGGGRGKLLYICIYT
jgi:hypothetical protein